VSEFWRRPEEPVFWNGLGRMVEVFRDAVVFFDEDAAVDVSRAQYEATSQSSKVFQVNCREAIEAHLCLFYSFLVTADGHSVRVPDALHPAFRRNNLLRKSECPSPWVPH